MIWRRVVVPTNMTLHELHGVLQVAMGWESIHLYAFDIYAAQYGSFELTMGSPRVPLAQFAFRKHDKFSYTYDMGDGWAHEVRVEGISAADPKNAAGRRDILSGVMKRMDMTRGRTSALWLNGWMALPNRTRLV